MSSWIHHNLTFVLLFMGWVIFVQELDFQRQIKKMEEQMTQLQMAMERRFGDRWWMD